MFCPNGNAANRVTIHITEVTLRDTSDTRILAAAPQYGPYVIANDGGTTGGSYNRISDTQSQFIKIQAYLEITSGTTGSSNGWHAVPPQCTKLSRFKVRCDFNSGAFTFVPTEGPGDSTAVAGAGRGACRCVSRGPARCGRVRQAAKDKGAGHDGGVRAAWQ